MALLLVWIPTPTTAPTRRAFANVPVLPAYVGDTDGNVCVWELKDDHQMDKDMDMDDAACNDNGRWCLVGRVTLLDMLPETPLMVTRKYQGKWLNTFSQHIIMCNIREARLTEVSNKLYYYVVADTDTYSTQTGLLLLLEFPRVRHVTTYTTSTTRARRAIKRMLHNRKEKLAIACTSSFLHRKTKLAHSMHARQLATNSKGFEAS
ncbi:unnamed protein product [Prunus armeniaca]|uniref:Uncharacterized protein n=1 Tax=Prunus armeniaca TaxID=36596 RepID=A0A6J5UL22_PRUAR|nr:unnamed protein product [Prunus armeniaca]